MILPSITSNTMLLVDDNNKFDDRYFDHHPVYSVAAADDERNQNCCDYVCVLNHIFIYTDFTIWCIILQLLSYIIATTEQYNSQYRAIQHNDNLN